MDDGLKLSLMAAGAGFIAIYFASGALGFFVALNARPSRRAAWTVGLPYLLATGGTAYLLALAHAEPSATPFPVDPGTAPLLMAPGALVVFLLRLWAFRAAWVDGVEDLADGENLANDDWRAGIIQLVIFIALLLAWAGWRFVLRSAINGL